MQDIQRPLLHTGSCHCGAVRFDVLLDATTGSRCNCSPCTKIGALTKMVQPVAFQLRTPAEALREYRCGPIGARYFCRTCGVYCYMQGSLEEVGGDFVSVNLLALDDLDPSLVRVEYWDGRHDNWYAGTRDRPWPFEPRARPGDVTSDRAASS